MVRSGQDTSDVSLDVFYVVIFFKKMNIVNTLVARSTTILSVRPRALTRQRWYAVVSLSFRASHVIKLVRVIEVSERE